MKAGSPMLWAAVLVLCLTHYARAESTSVFSEEGLGYTISYPGNWEYVEPSPYTVVFGGKKGTEAEDSTVTVQNLLSKAGGGKYASVDEVLGDLMNQFHRGAEQVRVSEEETFSHGELNGKQFKVEYARDGTRYEELVMVIPRSNGKIFHAFYYTAPANQFDNHRTTFLEMLDSWKMVEPTDAATKDEQPQTASTQTPDMQVSSDKALEPQEGAKTAAALPDAASVTLELTCPAGRSPRVFTAGWVFGARCLTSAGGPDEQDISNRVRWSGSGIFSPAMGAVSRPTFEREGTNTVVLTVQAGNREIRREYTVEAVSPRGYARLGDRSLCDADSHGCPACPHVTIGPIISGSPTVLIGGLPAARVGDSGVTAACCGPNTFVIAAGDSTVLIDGRPAARFGDRTQHCGGVGRIVDGASKAIPAWEAEYAKASKGESDWVAIPIRKGEIPQPVQPTVQPKPADTGSTDAVANQRQAILDEYRRLYPSYLAAFHKTSERVEVIANATEIGPDKYRCAYIAWGRIKDGPRKGEPAKDVSLDLTFTLQQLQGQLEGMKKLLGQ